MRHVTDGELHAFLDGGLDLLPGDRGSHVREHISSCSACQERLQDEEAVRSQAREILGDPALDEVPLPTFEELREIAEASGPAPPTHLSDGSERRRYRGPLRGLPLAWAATIVLALGVGWMGAQIWNAPVSDSLAPYSAIRYAPPAPTAAERSSLPLDSGRTNVTLVESEQAREEAAAEPIRAEVSEEAARIDAADRQVQVQELEAGAEPPPVSEVMLDEVVDVRPAEARAQLGENVPASFARVPVGDTVALGEALLREVGVTMDSAASMRMAQETARKTGGPPEGIGAEADALKSVLAVPGLKVVSTQWEERVKGERAFLIRQLLSHGDTLELRYLGLLLGTGGEPRVEAATRFAPGDFSGARAYANALEATLPQGWSQVVMERERGLLIARAPLSEDDLKSLLRLLR